MPFSRGNSAADDVEVHPLHRLPRSPLRCRLRAFFFPSMHRQWLATQGEELADAEPIDWFEILMVVAIVGNFVALASFDPFDHSFSSPRFQRLFVAEGILSFVFLLELVLRFACCGARYMLDPLRLVDSVIVIIGVCALCVEFSGVQTRMYGLTVVRTLRVLRPLQRLRMWPSVAIMINAFQSIVYRLTDASLLLVLFLVLFSVAGIPQFSGRLQTRCVNGAFHNKTVLAGVLDFYRQDFVPTAEREAKLEQLFWGQTNLSTVASTIGGNVSQTSPSPNVTSAPNGTAAPAPSTSTEQRPPPPPPTLRRGDFVCGGFFDATLYPAIMNSANLSWEPLQRLLHDPENPFYPSPLGCSELQTCDNTDSKWLQGYHCPESYACDEVGNPYDGKVSFDNFGAALLTMFTATTMQIWYEVAYFGYDSTSFIGTWYMNTFIIITGFLILNVFLVLIAVEFEKAKREERQRMRDNDAADGSGSRDTAASSGTSKLQVLVRTLIRSHKQPSSSSGGVTGRSRSSTSVGHPDGADGRRPRRAMGKWQRRVVYVRLFLQHYVTQREWFVYVCAAIILVNIGLLGYVHEGMPESDRGTIENMNTVITVLFTIELVIRFLAESPRKFFTDALHLFDLFVVCMCYVDMVVVGWNFRFVRTFRVFRVASILQIFPKIFHWVTYIVKCLLGAPVVLSLLMLVIAVFGVMCMHLLGGRFCDLETDPAIADNTVAQCLGRPRANFDTFVQAIISSFQVVTADDWNVIMYNAMQGRGDEVAIIFVLFYFISVYILLSILIGTMLSVHDDETAAELVHETSGIAAPSNALAATDSEAKLVVPSPPSVVGDSASEDSSPIALIRKRRERRGQSLIAAARNGDSLSHGLLEELEMIEREAESSSSRGTGAESALHSRSVQEVKALQAQFRQEFARDVTVTRRFDKTLKLLVEGRQAVRSRMMPVMDHVAVNIISTIVICIDTGAMAAENPMLPPDAPAAKATFIIGVCCVVFYIFEAIGNILAFGFIRGRDAYLRRAKSNIFDFALMLLGVVVTIMKLWVRRNQAAYIVQAALALRPLSLIKRSRAMRMVLAAIGRAVFTMRYVLTAIFLIAIFVAVVGVQILSGKMQRCYGPSGVAQVYLIPSTTQPGTLVASNVSAPISRGNNATTLVAEIDYRLFDRSNCTRFGGTWRNDGLNFDHVGEALLSLYSISTLEMWAELCYAAMDFDAVGQPPRTNAYPYAAIYFCLWAGFGGFFVAAILSTVLVDSYNKEIRTVKAQESLLVAREHNGWLLTNRRLLRCLPGGKGKKRDGVEAMADQALGLVVGDIVGFRQKLRELVKSERFMSVVLFLIFVNFAIGASQHYPESQEMDSFLYIADIVFSALFCAEAFLKIFAETPAVYFAAHWNKFDLFIALTSCVAVGTQALFRAKLSASVRSLRLLRLTRVLKGRSSITQLMQQFALALMSLGPVTAVIGAFVVTFAVMGKALFGRVVWGPFTFHNINHNINFADIGTTVNLLLRLSTGGDWMTIFQASRSNAPGCMARIGDCGPPNPIPQMYFVIFMTFAIHILKNLLVACMLDSFSAAANQRGMTKRDALKFHYSWLAYDPGLRLSIKAFDVLPLIRSLPATCPISLNGKRHRVQLELRFLQLLKIRDPRRERIKFRAVVDLLCRFAYQISPPPGRIFKFDFSKSRKKQLLPQPAATRDGVSSLSQTTQVTPGVAEHGSAMPSELSGGFSDGGGTGDERNNRNDDRNAKKKKKKKRIIGKNWGSKGRAIRDEAATGDGSSEVDDGADEDDASDADTGRSRLLSVIPNAAGGLIGAGVRLRGLSFSSTNGGVQTSAGAAATQPSAERGEHGEEQPQQNDTANNNNNDDDDDDEEELYQRSAAIIMMNAVIRRIREQKRNREERLLGFSIVESMEAAGHIADEQAALDEQCAFTDNTSMAFRLEEMDSPIDVEALERNASVDVDSDADLLEISGRPRQAASPTHERLQAAVHDPRERSDQQHQPPAAPVCELLGFSIDDVLKRVNPSARLGAAKSRRQQKLATRPALHEQQPPQQLPRGETPSSSHTAPVMLSDSDDDLLGVPTTTSAAFKSGSRSAGQPSRRDPNLRGAGLPAETFGDHERRIMDHDI